MHCIGTIKSIGIIPQMLEPASHNLHPMQRKYAKHKGKINTNLIRIQFLDST